MGALKLSAAALCLLWAAPAAAGPIDLWAAHMAEASERFRIPESWIRRVMAAESGGRTILRGRPIRSHAGALGLMQLMPGTWQEMRARLGLGHDPHEPRDNILAGAAYLRLMYDRFGYPGLFAAYNAGPARFANHRATGRRLPSETVAYVASVTRSSAALLPPQRLAEPPPAAEMRGAAPLFVVVAGSPGNARGELSRPPGPDRSLFVPLRTGAASAD